MTKNNRLLLVIFFCLILIVAIIIRLLYLQIIMHDDFVKKSQSQLKKIITIHSYRGNIYDRNGNVLAMSSKAYSIYAVPPKIEDKAKFADTLSPILEQSPEKIRQKIDTTRPFVWIQRKAHPDKVAAIKALNLPGINFIQDEKRLYPNGTLAADILGFVGTDGGLGGVEYQFDKLLSGSLGKIIIEGDPRGRQLISGKRRIQGRPKGFTGGVGKIEPTSFDGGHVHLTIDRNIQYWTQKFLMQAIKDQEAETGGAIVMNPKTGEILAMADYPEFNPNTFYDSTDEIRKNSTIVDVYEPGSIIKVMTLAAAIEEDIVTLNSTVIVPETYKLANRTIREAHRRKEDETDEVTASEILEKSLNVGTTLLAIELGEERFYKYLKAFGFGKQTGIQLPGESSGLLRPIKEWSEVDIGMISFGQGIGTTILQMAVAMSAVANGGIAQKPHIIKATTDSENVSVRAPAKQSLRRAISQETATDVLTAMTKTVNTGTAFRARTPGYQIGAKTGTAQIAGPGGIGYLKDKYVASFMGTFPTDSPQIVIVVSIHAPQKDIWGSSVSGPVFKNLADRLLDYLNIPPSNLQRTALK